MVQDGQGPAVPVGGGVPVDPQTGERFGYLPRKAARRKIIIRRRLGLHWMLAALGAALLIGVAGAAFLLSDPGRPAPRYADLGTLAAYPAGAVTPLNTGAGWVDRRIALTLWLTSEPYCEADGGWGAGPVRWDSKGILHSAGSGQANLRYADAKVARGHLYVDRSRSTEAPGSPGADLPSCPAARPNAP
ncbi:MAG: hypothetical protein ABI912_12810 [Actinomycetota bacterium]